MAKRIPENAGINTRLAHGGNDRFHYFGFVNPPVVHASTVLFPNAATLVARSQKYTYGTRGTPTTDALAAAIDELEGSAGTIMVPSGLMAVVVPLLAGCQGEQAANAPAVETRLASWDGTQQLVASHQGKVVVLDVWSTWCSPCVAEFPGLVELHRKHPGQVVCISLNCNFTGAAGELPGAERDQIEAFLTKQGAAFDNLICTTPDEQLFTALDAAAIPVVRVYDRSGKLRKQFDNDDNEYGEQGFRYEQHIAPLVEELLKE